MSELIIGTGHHFKETPDGNVWTCGAYSISFFKRYLNTFDCVKILARVQRVESVPEDFKLVNGEAVEVVKLPDFRGALGSFKSLFALSTIFRLYAKKPNTYFLLRVPGLVQTLFWLHLIVYKRNFGLEVIVDPALDFDPKSFGSKSGIVFKKIVTWVLKKQCQDAFCTSYVTEYTMQRDYPPGNSNTYSYSSIDIGAEAFTLAEITQKKIYEQGDKLSKVALSFTGDLTRPYKGLDLVLQAMHYLKSKGVEASLMVVGGGRMLDFYTNIINDLGLSEKVKFSGYVCCPDKIYEILLDSDIFVLPTRREGLPRAIIEAMAIGLPCISTNIAGIPEVLDDEDMIEMDDQTALNNKLERLVNNRDVRLMKSKRNSEFAKKFDRIILTEKREQFYRCLIKS